MKKKLLIPLFCLCLIFITSCGENKKASNDADNVALPSQTESKDSTGDETAKQTDLKDLDEIVSTDVDNTISVMKAEYEKMITDIDTYEKYLENTDKVEAFYKQIYEDTQQLCIRMREYSIDYAEVIMASDKSNDDKYKDFEEIYDCIYDDAGDDIYDEIYDGILDDLYDDFYDGILDDAYDNGVPYDEWSDARSDEYDWWSDARSDVYDEWSDFRSDVYDFYSDMRSELWDDDVERAEEKIVDFREDIEKLKSKDSQSNTQASNGEKSDADASEDAENKDVNENVELVDGMRPEFKEAMDSYEAFYDEYCDIMKRYTENPSDMELFTSYTDILTKASEMSEKFEAWEDTEMNDAELKYYLEVNNRVTMKLLDVYQ
ncbi:MAG: hypothetical protein NC393_07345 [Clostridium sp.]|nr:hypothetical protein [Clostridium sp.]MCM1207902.1 hypothetical protein [Ruminococcus sp.]